jgi:ATP-dependent Clp protease ATP-binding subunit ClpA
MNKFLKLEIFNEKLRLSNVIPWDTLDSAGLENVVYISLKDMNEEFEKVRHNLYEAEEVWSDY